eukprot:403336447
MKCIQIAKSAIQQKQFEKAKRFLEKGIRLHKTLEGQRLLDQVDRKLRGEDSIFNETSSQSTQSSHTHKKGHHGAAPHGAGHRQTEPQPQEPPNYSKEDVEKCRQILIKKDYYEILSLTRSAQEVEIKKAYKKLALKFHPDKNRAPNATDAFKKISLAFACLSNPDKRRIYDQTGSEEAYNIRQQQQQHHHHQEEFDPNDIFRAFFGGGNFFDDGMARRQQRRQPHFQHNQGQQQQQGPNPMALLQMAPLLLILLVSIIGSLGSGGTSSFAEKSYPYSFSQTYSYPVQVQSYRIQQTYFVSQYTAADLRSDLNRKYKLDEKVEEDLMRRYESKCDDAKKQRSNFLLIAKKYAEDSKNYNIYMDKAEQVDMEYCQQLKEFKKKVKQYAQ